MKRNSPKRREAKRQALIIDLQEVLDRPRMLEIDLAKFAEALIFLLEQKK